MYVSHCEKLILENLIDLCKTFFWDRVSLCSWGWPWIHCGSPGWPKLAMILLPQPPQSAMITGLHHHTWLIFSHLNYFGTFVKNQLIIYRSLGLCSFPLVYFLSILVHLSYCSSIPQTEQLVHAGNLFSTVLEAERSDSKCWQIWYLVRSHFLPHRMAPSPYVLIWWKGQGKSFGVFYKGTNPI